MLVYEAYIDEVFEMVEEDLGYRKIQRTGRSSYIISLPKEWITSNELDKGNQIAFKELEDSSLLLVPRGVLESREDAATQKEYFVQVSADDDPQSLSQRIRSLYAVGADLIVFKFKKDANSLELRSVIRNTARLLLGAEIIEESSSEIKMQILIGHIEFPIEKAVRRMFVLALSMDKDVVSSLESVDIERLQNVIECDNDLDRLNQYVIRQLKYGVVHKQYREMGFESPKEFLGYRIVSKNIENVGDNAITLAKNILILQKMISEKVVSLPETIDEEILSSVLKVNSLSHELFEESLMALFKRDYAMANRTIVTFLSRGVQLEKDAVTSLLTKKLDPNVAYVLMLVLESSRKMMEYSRDIAEVTLNRTVEEISKF